MGRRPSGTAPFAVALITVALTTVEVAAGPRPAGGHSVDAVSVVFSAVAIASILVAALLLAILGGWRFGAEQAPARGIALTAVTGAAVTALACAVQVATLPSLLVGPVVALGALFATVAASTTPTRSGWRPLVFAAVATAVVFVPVMVAVFGTVFDPFGTQLGVVDLGGGLPVFVAGGGISAGALLFGGRNTVPGRPASNARSRFRPALLLWLAVAGWLVGLELAVDDMVPIILTSVVLMPVAAGLAAAVTERLRSRRNTASGIVSGVLAGLAAAVPASPFVIPPIAVLIGLVVGAVSAGLPARLAGSAAVLGIGAGISAVLLGAVATNLGFIYTGQPELLFGQATIVVLAGG
jgi:Amt family ammonium transporter